MLVFVTLLAAAGWIFSREAIAGLPALTFVALRFSLAGVLLALFCRPALRRLTARQWRAALMIGFLFGMVMMFWAIGLRLTTHVGVGAFLCSLGLVAVPFISLLFGERPLLSAYLALPVAMAGLACLSLDGEFVLGVAELCFLLSALFIAVMYVLNSRAATHIPAMPLTSIQLLVAAGITAIGAAGWESPHFSQPMAIWGWFIASVLVATCLRFLLQTRAMGMTPPSHSAIIMNLEPVWTVLLAVLWLGERMSAMQVSGCGFIFLAMIVARWQMIASWLKSLRNT